MAMGGPGRAAIERADEATIELVPAVGPDGEARFHLEQRQWAEGIGWFTQKTIVLDARQARRLQQLLAVQSPTISRALAASPSGSGQAAERGRLLQFRRPAS